MTAPSALIVGWWRHGRARAGELGPRRSDWSHIRPRRDIQAGVTVGLVALPLALGFGVSSGMSAQSGLITAIIAGTLAAIFGGSRIQVSGPTGAMSVVLLPIIAAHGRSGVLVVGLLAGVILIALAISGMGRFIRYVPIPVVEGFTIGIAIIIALQQVPAALGVSAHANQTLALAGDSVRSWVVDPHWVPLAIATAVASGTLLLARLWPRLPGSLLTVLLATIATAALGLSATPVGHIPAQIPRPALPGIALNQVSSLVLPAIAVAALAALESLLSATVADAMSIGQRHDPDRELFGQGLANLVAPLFGGIPATAAIARTAVNIRSGATSRLAALTHALLLALIVLVAARWVGQIPLAALAGVLIATAIQMIRVSSLTALMRSTRGDAIVLVITAIATVLADLVTAVLVGLVVAGFVALRNTARTARLDEMPLDTPVDETDLSSEEQALLDEHIVCYRLEGPLFFAAAHDFLLELTEVAQVRVIILRMSRVTHIDATGAHVLADTISRLERRHVTVLLSGVQPDHEQVLTALGVYNRLAHERHLFATTPEAISHARLHAARITHPPAGSTA